MAKTRRTRDAEALELVGVRLPVNLLAKVDERVVAMSRESGFRLTRADVVRHLLAKALEASS